MRLLILSPYAPYPPRTGGRMRIWEQLRYFGARHDVTLISFYQAPEEAELRAAYAKYCRAVYLVARPARPEQADLKQLQALGDLFHWHATPEVEAVRTALRGETFDAVILHHIYSAQYRDWFASPNVVLEEQNIESDIFRQHAQLSPPGSAERTFRQSRYVMLKQYEDAMWRTFARRVVTCEADRAAMTQRGAPGTTLVVENGFDVRGTEFLPPPITRQVLFMGSLDYYPNIDGLLHFHETILPRLWAREPYLELVIAGRHPPELIRAFGNDPRVRVIADPEDMNALARESAVTIVPLRMGSGTRIKILHALALGRPVVTTPKGCEGLAVADEREVLVRDEPQAFADAVLRVLDDAVLAERLRENGRALVEAGYDWQRIWAGYEKELFADAEMSAGE